MRIGIVTQPLNGNFGGIMQNYALQTILKDLGHTPITLDFVQSVPIGLFILSLCKTVLKRLFLWRKVPFISRIKKRGDTKGNLFINENINKTDYLTRYSSKLIDQYSLEALVVGSDQVWRPSYNTFLYDMYLNFARDYDIKKFAFAASFGVSNKEYTEKEAKVCKELIRQFKGVSVREKSGKGLCKYYFDVDAEWLLDPTFLLPKERYLDLTSNILPDKSDFIGAYILDSSQAKENIVDKLKQHTGLTKVKAISNAQVDITVEEWLAVFRDAKFIITDSFHGTVFSIIFQKPFIVIPNMERGLDRFKSLLEYFSLERALINDTNCEIPDLSFYSWESVSEGILSNKVKVLDFLNQALH